MHVLCTHVSWRVCARGAWCVWCYSLVSASLCTTTCAARRPAGPPATSPRYFYYDVNRCQGDTAVDDTCVPCEGPGDCEVGEYFDIGECDGSGTEDNTCQECEFTVIGACIAGYYHDVTSCQVSKSASSSSLFVAASTCSTFMGRCVVRGWLT